MRASGHGAVSTTEPATGAGDAGPAPNLRWYLPYKLFNSLFLGLSIGTVFVLYTPLSPEVFSAGGIGLAIATLLVATQYQRLLNARWYFRIAVSVELVILAGILAVLLFDLNWSLAMFVYLGYQLTFVFGNYLLRCETLLIPGRDDLTRLDVVRQIGYLIGMAAAWAIYRALGDVAGVSDKNVQVVLMHYPLLLVELTVLGLLVAAFTSAAPPAPEVSRAGRAAPPE